MTDPHADTRDVPAPILDWAAGSIASGAEVVAVKRLRTDGGPWLLHIDDDGVRTEAVLKYGPSSDWSELYTCEATALRLAAEHDISAPRVLGFEHGMAGNDGVALLLSRLAGTTQIPRTASVDRLRDLGRVAAAIHRIPLRPSGELPVRTRHTSWTDLALWRRWGNRYRAASESDRESILCDFITEHPLGGMGEMTDAVPWSIDAAHETLSTTDSTPLLDTAGKVLVASVPPQEPTVFVHGDLWQGNTLWEGDRCVGVIDWEVAGAGHPGVDLGCLRWDAAMTFGGWAADEVRAGWEQAAERPARAVAYWDLVAVLNYPADMRMLISTLEEQGRPDLDVETLTERRDAYVEAALSAHGRERRVKR